MQSFQPPSHTVQPPSPVPSNASSHDSNRVGSNKFKSGANSPYLHNASYHPYAQAPGGRRFSVTSTRSHYSQDSPRSASIGFDDDGKEKGRCPNQDCGRYFKDLKAHMLTHMSERPEKCPIVICDYHQKGFARKYDRNRHVLTHYKGTMICPFCPGSGTAAEKSFNRHDVFKRHLTSVHGVEQPPPNSRRKSPVSASSRKSSGQSQDKVAKCSTCSAMFKNAQDFYEHLDECVLQVVQQQEPSEAINEARLAEGANDPALLQTLDRHNMSARTPHDSASNEENDDGEEEPRADEDWTRSNRSNPRSGKGSIQPAKGNSS